MYKYQRIARAIERNLPHYSHKLPTIRELAAEYGVTKTTITNALKQLEAAHLIYSRQQSDYFLVDQAENLQTTTGLFDFANASPEANHFPYHHFTGCIHQALNTHKDDLFTYGQSQGFPPLIQSASKLLQADQIFARPEHIFITSGAQQALSILCQMPFPNSGDTILIESPTYPLFEQLAELYNLTAIPIKRTKNGINLKAFNHLLNEHNVKFFYTIPRFHNPLGFSNTNAHNQTIADIAATHNTYIIEDDYLADLDTTNTQPLYAEAKTDHVIYLKSFSKVLFPGLRISVAVLPANLASSFHTYKQLTDIDSSLLPQIALQLFVDNGMLSRHLDELRQHYSTKLDLFQSIVADHPIHHDLPYLPPKSLKTHLPLPNHFNLRHLMKTCQEQRILLPDNQLPGALDTAHIPLLLELSTIPLDTLEEATQHLLDIILTYLNRVGD